MSEAYVHMPLPPATAAKLKRLARANGRRASREAAQIVIREVARRREPAASAQTDGGAQ